MQATNQIGDTMLKYAKLRFQQFSGTSLHDLSEPSDVFCNVHRSFLEFLVHNRDAVCTWLDEQLRDQTLQELMAFFSGNMIRYLHNRNQFLVLDADHTRDLNEVYHQFLRGFRTVLDKSENTLRLRFALQDVFASHQSNLEQFVRDLYPTSAQYELAEPVCNEYSPELQLAMLHITIDDLSEPILDVGCGSHGNLVNTLNQQGKIAFGIDRDAISGTFTKQVDWFDYHPAREAWGTIISHMALSNHFLHQHLNPAGNPEAYAHLYMSLLHALKPGGQFIYTPGLPFIEDLLPADQYTVDQYPITQLHSSPIDRILRQQLGESVLYATRITKLV